MEKVQAHTITSGTLSVQVIEFGASLVSLRFEDSPHSLVLGYPTLDSYLVDKQYMGAVIGRYANRIAGGNAIVSNKAVSLEKNEAGINHLHGGTSGFGSRYWQLSQHTENSVSFMLDSRDGESGYPGNIRVEAIYEIVAPATLSVVFKAKCDADTLINICHHPYFNLDGSKNISNHELYINSSHVLPTNDALIPTGERRLVNKTRFDFETPSHIHNGPYNNTYCLHEEPSAKLRHAATLTAGTRSMDIWTTQPGLHLYDGYKLQPTALGHEDRLHHAGAGVCLEAQAWPDSQHHEGFPDVQLKADTLYEQITQYRFYSI